MKSYRAILLLLISASCLTDIAIAASPVLVRPHIGYGYIDSTELQNTGNLSHAGMRLLLTAGGNKRYGLEATRFTSSNGNGFYSLGIVLEQRLWRWFNMSIGTVGYFDYAASLGNPVGLMTNLGWEPNTDSALKPFITYRNDLIFSENTGVAHSLSAGLSFEF